MNRSALVKSVLADLLTGLAALGVVMAGFVSGALPQNLRTQVFVVSALFLLAGLIRGAAAPSNPWIKGSLVNLGSSVPVCAMAFTGMAFTSRPHLVVFLATSWLAAVTGAYVRRSWRLGHPRESLAVAGAWAVAVISVSQLFVPMMLEKLATEQVRHAAPAFSFRATNGGRITNESLHGHVAVLAFWATWCPPCREELPRLNTLYGRYSKSPDVAFWAVDAEHGEDLESSARKAEAYFARTSLSLPLAMADDETSGNLGVHSLPALLIIDQRGYIRLVHTGYDGAESIERIVNSEVGALLRSKEKD